MASENLAASIGEPYAVPGLVVSDHKITAPLDYTGQLEGQIDVFFRVAKHVNTAQTSLPYLLYLQGELDAAELLIFAAATAAAAAAAPLSVLRPAQS